MLDESTKWLPTGETRRFGNFKEGHNFISADQQPRIRGPRAPRVNVRYLSTHIETRWRQRREEHANVPLTGRLIIQKIA